MAQYVIEFGAEKLRFIGEAIRASLAEPHEIVIDSTQNEMSYADTGKTLCEVLEDLEAGIVRSAIIRNSDPRIRYALITSPKVHVPGLTLWMGTIEVGVENWRFIWDLLLRQFGLKFVCAGAEEGVELSDEQISPGTFPWTAHHLIVAAVRMDDHSDWVVRDRVAL